MIREDYDEIFIILEMLSSSRKKISIFNIKGILIMISAIVCRSDFCMKVIFIHGILFYLVFLVECK